MATSKKDGTKPENKNKMKTYMRALEDLEPEDPNQPTAWRMKS